jgi:hypothetical protein
MVWIAMDDALVASTLCVPVNSASYWSALYVSEEGVRRRPLAFLLFGCPPARWARRPTRA